MTFHMQNKNRSRIKKDINRHVLNDLNFNIKRRENLEAAHLPSFENGTDKNCQWQLERRRYSMDVHTHWTHSSHKRREICNHVLEGKKSFKGLNFNK